MENPAANPIDRHVGMRIRQRRRELKISQERLAEAIGLTFQQVQKYERAANRVSASKLYEVAQALGAPVTYFFDGLEGVMADPATPSGSPGAREFLLSAEGAELAAAFPRIAPRPLRRKILDLMHAILEERDED